LDADGRDKAIIRAFQTRKEFANTRSHIDKSKLDQLVAMAYWFIIKNAKPPFPTEQVPAIIEEALNWANTSRPELVFVVKKTAAKKVAAPGVPAAPPVAAPTAKAAAGNAPSAPNPLMASTEIIAD